MERLHLDKADPNMLHDEITVIDHALTRPWTVDKKYVPQPEAAARMARGILHQRGDCADLRSARKYYRSPEGRLMPTKQDQPPPDLRYFPRSGK